MFDSLRGKVLYHQHPQLDIFVHRWCSLSRFHPGLDNHEKEGRMVLGHHWKWTTCSLGLPCTGRGIPLELPLEWFEADFLRTDLEPSTVELAAHSQQVRQGNLGRGQHQCWCNCEEAGKFLSLGRMWTNHTWKKILMILFLCFAVIRWLIKTGLKIKLRLFLWESLSSRRPSVKQRCLFHGTHPWDRVLRKWYAHQ